MPRIQHLQDLTGHQDRVWHLAWNPAQPTLASCSTDKSVRLYSYSPTTTSSSSPSSSSEPAPPPYRFSLKSTIPTSHTRTVRALAFSPTGATLATASFDSTVGIWCQVNEAGLDDGEDAAGAGAGAGAEGEGEQEWEPVDPLEGHESECKSVAWSADGRLLASCSRDKSVWVWEAVGPADFECLAVLMEHSQDVKSVVWHPTDELLASASYDDTIKLYAADPFDDEWQCVATLTEHTATVWTLAFSPCGRYLASAGDDLCIKLWERVALGTDGRDLGELGEAKPQDGGRMGNWSAGGVRIGVKEKWRWVCRGQVDGAHERTVYALDWKRGGVDEEEGGLGRILTGGGDGRINVFQMTKPPSPDAPPSHTLVASIEDSHGVSDVNHVAWCDLSPAQAAAKLRALEGEEGEADEAAEAEAGGRKDDQDPRWRGVRDMFASAGDDGVVKVWRVEG
ncbi:hypothetical protein JCM10207_001896 [Rhodosporidiobolus poonsookiae]